MPVYTYPCPKGHQSSESDFCSECGARIQGVPQGSPFSTIAPPSGMAASSSQVCPDCGAPRTDTSSNFCEVCGYNFSTGAHGNITEAPPPVASPRPVTPPPPVAPPPPPAPPVFEPTPAPPPAADEPPVEDPPVEEPPAPVPPTEPEPPKGPAPPKEWTLVAAVDPSLAEPGGPEPPANVDPITVALDQPVSLIGRKSEKRAILPEVSLDLDDGVSHRHALLTWGDDGSLTLRDIGSSNGTRLNGVDVKPLVDIVLHDGDQITLGRWSRLTVKTV